MQDSAEAANGASPATGPHEPTWTQLTNVASPSAVVLVAGGLNTRSPVIFADLAQTLELRGVAVHALELSGHRADPTTGRAPPGTLGRVSLTAWVDEVEHALDVLADRNPDVPRLGIGYSMGGAAMLLAQLRGSVLDGIVGLAPAIAMTPLTRALNRLNYAFTRPFGLDSWAWRPTALPERYRANDYVPPRALWTGEEAQRSFAALGTDQVAAWKGRLTIVMRQRDPVISARAVRRFVERHELDATWCDVPSNPGVWAHEVFDRQTLGDAWEAVVGCIVDRLERARTG